MRYLVGALVSAAVLAGFHWVTYRWVLRPLLGKRRWLIPAMAMLGLTIPLAIVLLRNEFNVGHSLAWVSFPWLALVGLCTMYALVLAPLGWLRTRAAQPGETQRGDAPDPGRREAILRVLGGTALTAATGQIAYGATQALGDHVIERVTVTLARLPPALSGFRIVQVTDLHIGTTIGRSYIQTIVDRANALAPDLIVLTGDLVDGSPKALAEAAAPLAQLRAPHGVYAVTGNHEYYSGADRWIAHFRDALGIPFLRNERVTIERDGAAFDLAGIDDWSAHQVPGHGADLDAALQGRDPSRALVLLAHQPRQVRGVAGKGVDLQLSGHTHGGQIFPWHALVWLQQGGYVAGRYQVGATTLYVNRGAAYWGPPVRLGAPLEIAEITLAAA